MTHEQLQDAHIAALREIVELKATLDEQVEENRGLRRDVLLMQKANVEQRAEIEQLQARLRTTAQLGIAEIGAEGPEDVESVVGRLVAKIQRLQAQLPTAKNDFDLQRDYANQLKDEVDRLKAQLATAKEQVFELEATLNAWKHGL